MDRQTNTQKQLNFIIDVGNFIEKVGNIMLWVKDSKIKNRFETL